MTKYEIFDKKHNNNWNLDLYFDSIGDAYNVLDTLIDIADEDEKVSVHEYFNLSGVPDLNEEVTKCLKWKYEDIRKSSILRTKYGYKIILPKNITIEERSEK